MDTQEKPPFVINGLLPGFLMAYDNNGTTVYVDSQFLEYDITSAWKAEPFKAEDHVKELITEPEWANCTIIPVVVNDGDAGENETKEYRQERDANASWDGSED